MIEPEDLDKRLGIDLGGLVKRIGDYGPRSEEVREYVQETMKKYNAGKSRQEFLGLAATLIYGCEQVLKEDN